MKKFTESQLRKIIREAIGEPMTQSQATSEKPGAMRILRELSQIISNINPDADHRILLKSLRDLLERHSGTSGAERLLSDIDMAMKNMTNLDDSKGPIKFKDAKVEAFKLKNIYRDHLGSARNEDPDTLATGLDESRMKITSSQLRKIIKEEYNKLVK